MTATAARGTYWSHADAPSAIVRCANGDEESELVAAGFTRITALYNPHPHRCAGLPEGTRAYVAALPQGERVTVYYDTPDGMDCLARAFRFCGGCGASASFLLALLRGEAPELPFGDPVGVR